MDLTEVTARDLLALLRSRQVSARELLDRHLERIEHLNRSVNAVVTLDVDRARVEARVIDDQLARGRLVGPLHGLPMTVKDTFETVGMRTVAGSPMLSDHVPRHDALAVGRLKQAGAIVFGKTNTPALASDWQTTNDVFGTTNNPWDLTLTAGGSSGGSAAALAAGMTPLELGSDIGGSIRMPAAMCGVAGHKPTFGIVPQRGHIPGPPGSLSQPDLGVVGPMARSVDDLTLLLDVLAGPIEPQSRGWSLELPQPSGGGLRSWRLATFWGNAESPVDTSVLNALTEAAATLQAAGATLQPLEQLPLRQVEIDDLYRTLLLPVVGEDRRLSHSKWLAANEQRLRMHEEVDQFFESYDALLVPAFPTLAFAHDHRPLATRTLMVNGKPHDYIQTAQTWAGLATTLHLPATVIPAALSSGLPVGLQIIGRYLNDRTTLRIAADIENVLGRLVRPANV